MINGILGSPQEELQKLAKATKVIKVHNRL